jgi:O-antigen/teichoic acid export membrane protein
MFAKFKLFTKTDFFKGSAILTVSAFLVNIFNYFFSFVIGRTLGPSGFGEFTAIFSYAYIFSVPMSVISTVIIQKIGSAEHKIEKAMALENLFWEKMARFRYIFILLIFAPFIFSRISNLSIASSIFFFLLMMASFIGSFYNSILRGLKMFLYAGIMSTMTASIKFSSALITFVPFFKNIYTILSLILAASILECILIYKYFAKKKVNHNSVRIEKRIVQLIFNHQMIIATISLMGIALLNNADVIFVKKFFSASNAGLYSAWSLFAKIILYGLGPLLTVSFISFTEKSDHKKTKYLIFLWFLFFMFIGASSYFFYSSLSSTLVAILFGSGYLKIAANLGLAGIFGTFYTLIVFMNGYFLAKKSKYSLIVALFIPFYLLSLYFTKSTISNVMNINIIFSGLISLCYLLAFLKRNPE